MRNPVRLAAALLVLAPLQAVAEGSASAPRPRLCPEDAPPGVRLPNRPGCGAVARRPVGAGRAPGTIEIAPGTTVRVGGRARFDYDVRR